MQEGITSADLDFLGRIENGVSLSKLTRAKWEETVGCTLEEEVAKLVNAGLVRHASPEESLSKQFAEHELRAFFDPESLPDKGGKAKLAKLAVEYADAETLKQLMDMCPVFEATGEGRIYADEHREITAARAVADRRRSNLAHLRRMLPEVQGMRDIFPFVLWSSVAADASCSECRANDGKIFRVEDIKEFPPRYCNCVDCCPCILTSLDEESAKDLVRERKARWAK
ncbi:MAG: hypothetical protein IJQ73_07505 [Kiritimatiellae bacterium]|nr:hypothetical protein [Kiritimatiellia bacterium]